MPLKTESIEIADVTVHVTQLSYFRAQRLLTSLVKLAGPALVGLGTLAGGGNARAALASLLNRELSDLQPVLASFFEQLDPVEAERLTKEILATAHVEQGGKPVMLLGVIDAVMGGEFWGVMALQLFALKVHFGNFSGARDAFGKLGLKAPESPSAGSNTSTDGTAGS